MHRHYRFLAMPILLLLCFQSPAQAAVPTITLPLCFHIVQGMPMQKKGVLMESRVSEHDITSVLVPEVNHIWSQAGIRFRVQCIDHVMVKSHPDQDTLIRQVEQARRDEHGKADKTRIHALDTLLGNPAHDGSVIHVYLVPYLGETSQGNTSRKQRRVYLGQWTDKASGGQSPPVPFQLAGKDGDRQGSLGRTLAHELGHVLDLKNTDKTTQTEFGLLMGGKKEGERLLPEEVRVARQHARKSGSE
jgi:hypothetical protein